MGDAGVNKSIGSQWKNKGIAKNMDDHIREQAAKMTPEERRTTKLNVELDHMSHVWAILWEIPRLYH